MKKVLVVGAGQLGSRHLQGIKKAENDIEVYALDTNKSSLNTALVRWDEILEHKERKLNVLHTISSIPKNIDVMIVATSSNVRFQVTQAIIEHSNVKYVIFEKVLFQKEEEYFKMDEVLKQKNIKAWVNCPRRMFSFNKELKNIIKNSESYFCSYTGTDWGLGCNGIHYIDYFAYLFGDTVLTVDTSGIDEELIESKRKGFIEFNGCLNGSFSDNKGRFALLSTRQNIISLLSINTEKYHITINESKGELCIKDVLSNTHEVKSIELSYQSDLSGVLVDDLLNNSNCKLTTFEESKNLHLPLLRGLLSKYNEIKNLEDNKICPIT